MLTKEENELVKLFMDKKIELNKLVKTGKITEAESQQRFSAFEAKVKAEIRAQDEQSRKGAVPKQIMQKSPKKLEPKKQIDTLDKKEKFLYKHLNSNRISCIQCRKLIERILNERTRVDGSRLAENHLTSSHGIKIMQKLTAPPISEEEQTWDNSAHSLSLGNLTVTSQSQIGGNFPLQPPAREIPTESDAEIIMEDIGISREDEGAFKVPKNTKKRKASPHAAGIETSNKYQLLTESEYEVETPLDTENEENLPRSNARKNENTNTRRKATPSAKKTTGRRVDNPNQTERVKIKKFNLPPPFIIKGLHGKSSYDTLKQKLTSTLLEGFTFKYTKNNTIIQVSTIEKYEQLKLLLQQGTDEWHTYATEGEKSHAFVAKGLDNEPDLKDIIDEMREVHQIEVKQIYPMRTKYRMLYLIITPASILLKHIQKIKYLSHTEVQWELRRKFTSIIQCKSCYQWGHSRIYCNRMKRCAKCGETHDAEECNNPIKCANCGGEHPATDTKCPVYKYRSDKIQERQNKQQPKKYTEAPKPVENIWEQRRIRMEARRQNQHLALSTDEDETEAEAAAFPKRKPQTRNRQEEDIASIKDTNVSELLYLTKQFKLIGNKLAEAFRFLTDFLHIFDSNNKQEKAFSLLQIMTNLDKYDF